jgi:peptidoglycan/LPS O-acetylase OafA/YrhL
MANAKGEMGYVPGLDGLRSVAAILVVAFHARVPTLSAGFLGVDIFFVLSGFLISTLLLQEIDRTGSVALRAFWRKRMVRLFPALAALVIAFLCVFPWLPVPAQAPLMQAILSLLYVVDYARAFSTMPNYLGYTWSLSVEAKFYLLWPLILTVLTLRLTPWALVRAIVLMAIAASAWRVFNAHLGLSWDLVYFRFDTRLSGLFFGSAVAAALRAGFRPNLPRWAGLFLLSPLALNSLSYGDPVMLTWPPLIVELATVLVILMVLQGGMVASALSQRSLTWLGPLSYGIYLWHYPIISMLRDEMHWTLTILVGGGMSTALAWLSFHTIERWARRYRSAQPQYARSIALDLGLEQDGPPSSIRPQA